jgi:hypothetical protein
VPSSDSGSLLWELYLRALPLSRTPCARLVDGSALFQGVPTIAVDQTRGTPSESAFRPDDLERVRGADLDAIMDFHGGERRGQILTLARHGVWRLRYGAKHSGPAGFREIMLAEPTTWAVLERLDEQHGPTLLQSCCERTETSSWRGNLNAIVLASVDLPARAGLACLHGLRQGGDRRADDPAASSRQVPDNRAMLRFLWRVAHATIASNLRGACGETELWNVGIVDAPIHRFLEPGFRPAIRWLTPLGPARYAADPFGIAVDDGLLVLFEEFDLRTWRGRIAQMTLGEGRRSAPVTAIDNGAHMAYPQLLEHDGKIYCLPTTSDRRELALYRLDPASRRWSKDRTLIEGVALVDASIARYDERWWIFAADDDDHRFSKLFAWHADSLFGPWQPHAANPVKIDVRSSRPGGTPFEYQGALYRPAQDNSRTYGGRIALNRIVRLTPLEFEEEVVAVVEPPARGYSAGLHTLSAVGDRTLLDAKRLEVKPYLIPRRLRHKLGRLVDGIRRQAR